MGNVKEINCLDFFIYIYFNFWDLKNTFDLEDHCLQGGACRIRSDNGNKLWLSWLGLSGASYLNSEKAMGRPWPHSLWQIPCSLHSTLSSISFSVSPWLPCLFSIYSACLLACWPVGLSAYVMMNSLHGYNDPTVSWQGQTLAPWLQKTKHLFLKTSDPVWVGLSSDLHKDGASRSA